jgi:hypothetical protein
VRILKDEGYIENNEECKENKGNKESEVTSKNDNIVFKFGLRFYFNVVIRILRKTSGKIVLNNIDNIKEIIYIYMESDINKAKYILEEFSNTKAIDEYLIYCPNGNSSKDCNDIIMKAFYLLYEEENDIENENSIIYEFLNSLITYISNNIKKTNLDNVNKIFYQIINKNVEIFLNYLYKKHVNDWVQAIYSKINCQEIFESVFNEENIPTLKSGHSIITEKIKISDDDDKNKDISYEKPKSEENDIYDSQFFKNTNDFKSNETLLYELKKNFNRNNC